MDNLKETLHKIRSWKINELDDTLDLYKSSYPGCANSYFLACNDDTMQGNEIDQAWDTNNLFIYISVIDSLSRIFKIECTAESIIPIVEEANLLVLLYL